MARIKGCYEVEINLLGQLLGYTLQGQSITRSSCWKEPRPVKSAWRRLPNRFHPTEPMIFEATGFFGPTAPIEVYPRDEMHRGPQNRLSFILHPRETCSVGVLTLRRLY